MSAKAYLQLLARRHDLDAFLDLPPEERELLEILAVQADLGNPMIVSQAIRLNRLASQATLHKRLKRLVHAGLVNLVHEGPNHRTKFIVPTKRAMVYFKHAGASLAQDRAA
jgi:DNA-binding MarR family transcriptional regulator